MLSITEYALKRRKVVWFLILMTLIGGLYAFFELGKKEDSTFVIKSAAISCNYPGASPLEVEQLITEPIERELQSLPNLHKLKSQSRYGSSRIILELEPSTPAERVPQLWDELRRRVLNLSTHLPNGASAISVNDDFGDLYGLYYALAADNGYSSVELREWAQKIKRRLSSIDGVKRATLYGEQSSVINVHISLAALAGFSIRPDKIVATISGQNKLYKSGIVQADELQIEILESGTYSNLDELRNQLLIASDGKQFRLGDIARIERSDSEPPQRLMRLNGRDAIGIGISTDEGEDVVKVGQAVKRAIDELQRELPLGVELSSLYSEDKIARDATNDFIENLLLSLLIVVGVIMLSMGLRSGLTVGASLILSIAATLLTMLPLSETLNRTSLAGFIIAMGMLVDNAIVVTENARSMMGRGIKPHIAFNIGASRPKWSLLGATLIAIFSFLPLYLAPSSVAEIIKPLFTVIAISLLSSWLLSLTQVPLFGIMLKVKGYKEGGTNYLEGLSSWLVKRALRHRIIVVISMILLFVASLWSLRGVPQNFFPELDKPYIRADVILPEGYNIFSTLNHLSTLEQWLIRQPEVKGVSYTAGGTPPRYYLASASVDLKPNFGNLLIELHDSHSTKELERRLIGFTNDSLPNVWLRASLFKLSPVPDAAIEFGFLGESIDTLLMLSKRAEEIVWQEAGCKNIRQSWGNRIPTWEAIYSQMKGQRIGVSRGDMVEGIRIATDGFPLGEYREGDSFMPILLRDWDDTQRRVASLESLPLFAPSQRIYTIGQASNGFRLDFKCGVIEHFNQQRVIKVQCDPKLGVNTKSLFNRLLKSIREMELPEGYTLKVFGEQESQEESNRALGKRLPLTLFLIIFTLIVLFDNYTEPLIILLSLPLILIGVVWGLRLSGRPFDFFSLLGLLGLMGMSIKSGIVLLDEILQLREEGIESHLAIIRAVKGRATPVTIASGTTILGMIPLLSDSLFGSMAASIMGGLFVATLLTIILIPTLYSLLHNIKPPKIEK